MHQTENSFVKRNSKHCIKKPYSCRPGFRRETKRLKNEKKIHANIILVLIIQNRKKKKQEIVEEINCKSLHFL